jgi:4-azaleucine resistance transporter AzlC
MPSARLQEFAGGMRDTVPMLVGSAPFGVIFGTLAAAGDLALWQGQLLSLSVYAGASQFVALGLFAGGAGFAVIWATTLIVNLRHVFYAANLLPRIAPLPAPWRWLLGFLLTDETFAVMAAYYARHPVAPLGHWYYLGSGVAMYLNWQAWTFLGLAFGASFPALQSYGLDFAMVATFIAIVVPQLTARPRIVAAVVAAGAAFLLRGLPYQLGLLLAVACGVLAGLMLLRWNPVAEPGR